MPPKGPKEGKGGSVNIQFYTSDLRVVCFQEGKEEISLNPKMIRRVEVAREARKVGRKENRSRPN